ncbi:thyroid receptor-interacting protein 11-like [Drosophila subpulchrella]|uniref:thyroid receptor-interacting protein 11-like n=1 Tax=Drosophila subpulchrella TaxID=1486046 RepID=UPI0018A139DE|nr:thyroid receptor-interacting protein 11-like [Drosophila subpulchrella]
MSFAKEQIRTKALITKYRLKLVHLQDAEIFKVTEHLEQMEDLLTDVNNRLVNLRSKIVKESDAKVRQVDVTNSFHLVREQHKTKVLCERWQDRLDQLKKARIVRSDQLLHKPTSFQKPQQQSRLLEKPKTEHQKLQEALVLEASKAKGVKNSSNEIGCKRCAFLSKMKKQEQPRLCRVCKKWADDKGKAKETVTKKSESNDLEVRVCMDSSSTESTIKIEIEPVELKEIEEMRSLENKTISNSKPPQLLKPVEQLPGKPGELNINGKRLRAVPVNKTNNRLKYLRVRLQRETNQARRMSFKEKTMSFAKEQIRTKALITKYRLKLVHLQDAEIFKVTKHLEQMEDLLTDVNNRLVNLRSKIVKESDAKVRQVDVTNSFHTTSFQKPQQQSRLLEKPKTEHQKLQEALVLEASKAKGVKNSSNEIGCKRCAFLSKMKKQGQPRLCRVCKKWADDKGKAKETVTKKSESNDLEVRMCMDSSSTESTIKIEIEEDQVTSKDSIDPKIITSIQDTLKSIDSKNMALAHLKILQVYAMLNDNFRAIGLLTEVEKSIIHHPKKEDFDL